MNSPAPDRIHPPANPADEPAASANPAGRPADPAARRDDPAGLPPGPLTTAELLAAVPDPRVRAGYRRIWHGVYRRADQVDDLRLRGTALARTFPEGVLRGRSAALLWGDDSVPTGALPEIWLPSTRRACEGRVYRYGALPSAAITEVDGVRVTTPLRTCRDLACDLDLESAVVAVERLCAVVQGLAEQLRAAAAHPSGRGARRFTEVVGAVEPRSGSEKSTRARLALAAAGLHGFTEGHQIRINGRLVTLPLADPVGRCVVIAPGGQADPVDGAAADRLRALLRRAGWTVLVVRGPDVGAIAGSAGAGAAVARSGTGVGAAALEVLTSRWPATRMLPPLSADAAADPLGLWSGRRAQAGQRV